MAPMLRRRRPIARLAAGAAVGGAAYHAGKRHAQQAAPDDAAADVPQQPSGYAEPPASSGDVADLDRLAAMHDAGTLSDEEFAAAKAKLLGI